MTLQTLLHMYKAHGMVALYRTAPNTISSGVLSKVEFSFSSHTAYRIESLIKYYFQDLNQQDLLFMKALLSNPQSLSFEWKKPDSDLVHCFRLEYNECFPICTLSSEEHQKIFEVFKRSCTGSAINVIKRYEMIEDVSGIYDFDEIAQKEELIQSAFTIAPMCEKISIHDHKTKKTMILEKIK